MTTETLKETLRRELPTLLRDDPALRDYILAVAYREFPSRAETEDRFYQILGEIRRDREEQSRRWDEQSREVFGHPDQVEIDVIVKNGLLILCELKSSVSKSDIVIFGRKARFYERRHQEKANRLIVISPMIDDRARQAGVALGLEMYGDSLDVDALE
ncbi:DUF3782 domain-containing protein [Gammaproteobacteria bacterium]